MKYILYILLFARVCHGQNGYTKHFYAGFGITVISAEVINQCIERPAISSAIGFGLGCLATIVKETVYDGYMEKGTKSFADGMVGCFGSGTGAMVIRVRFDLQDKKKHKAIYKDYYN